jgi:hypothetical protein
MPEKKVIMQPLRDCSKTANVKGVPKFPFGIAVNKGIG